MLVRMYLIICLILIFHSRLGTLQTKIKQAKQQTQIIIGIKQTNGNAQDFGQVQIDLDQLMYQKIKYIAFGKFQKILQLQSGTKNRDKDKDQSKDKSKEKTSKIQFHQKQQQKQTQLTSQQKRIKNKQFIQQRKKFLQNYTTKQNQLKQQFQQKLSQILSQEQNRYVTVHRKRIGRNLERNVNMNTNYQNQKKQFDHNDNNYMIVKGDLNGISQYSGFRARSAFHQNSKNNDKNTINNDYGVKSPSMVINSPRKHKLILNTLNIVSKQDKNI